MHAKRVAPHHTTAATATGTPLRTHLRLFPAALLTGFATVTAKSGIRKWDLWLQLEQIGR
jgi:hypothetical protein